MTFDKNLPLLIFDLDGTLIDSAQDIHQAMNQMLTKYGHQAVSFPILVSHIGDGLKKLVHDFFPEFQYESVAHLAKVDEFLKIYESQLVDHTTMYPGVEEFLKSYTGPKAIITNKSIHPTRLILKHFGLDKLSWVDVIGGDSLPERKPSALPLRHVMTKSDSAPDKTWMIGDGRPDMLAAKAAGCLKVAAHYGYLKPEELDIFQPDFILKKFTDLKNLIQS